MLNREVKPKWLTADHTQNIALTLDVYSQVLPKR